DGPWPGEGAKMEWGRLHGQGYGRQAPKNEAWDQCARDRGCQRDALLTADPLALGPPDLARNDVHRRKDREQDRKGQCTSKADPQEADRQYLDVTATHQVLRIEVEHDAEHEGGEG